MADWVTVQHPQGLVLLNCPTTEIVFMHSLDAAFVMWKVNFGILAWTVITAALTVLRHPITTGRSGIPKHMAARRSFDGSPTEQRKTANKRMNRSRLALARFDTRYEFNQLLARLSWTLCGKGARRSRMIESF